MKSPEFQREARSAPVSIDTDLFKAVRELLGKNRPSDEPDRRHKIYLREESNLEITKALCGSLRRLRRALEGEAKEEVRNPQRVSSMRFEKDREGPEMKFRPFVWVGYWVEDGSPIILAN